MHGQVPTTTSDPIIVQIWPFSKPVDNSSDTAAALVRSCPDLAWAHGFEHRAVGLGTIQEVGPYCRHIDVEAGAVLGQLLELYRIGGFSMHHSVNCSDANTRNEFVHVLGMVRASSRHRPLCTCLGANCKAAYCDPCRFLVFQALADAILVLQAHTSQSKHNHL